MQGSKENCLSISSTMVSSTWCPDTTYIRLKLQLWDCVVFWGKSNFEVNGLGNWLGTIILNYLLFGSSIRPLYLAGCLQQLQITLVRVSSILSGWSPRRSSVVWFCHTHTARQIGACPASPLEKLIWNQSEMWRWVADTGQLHLIPSFTLTVGCIVSAKISQVYFSVSLIPKLITPMPRSASGDTVHWLAYAFIKC